MALRELRMLVAVADRGSLTAAADSLHLSLPAASAQIARLEGELRCELLDRGRKPARLNAAGQALVVRARELLAGYARLHEAVSDPHDLAGTLTLGAIPTALTGVIPRALLALRSAHPRLQVHVRHGLSPSFAEQLRRRELDAAIISEPPQQLADIRWTPFAEEPIVVIAPRDAAARSDEALLRTRPYIRFNRHFWVSRRIDESLVRRGIVVRETMELDSLEAIGQMVRHGLGVSIIPLSDTGFLRLHRLRALPFGRPGLTRRIGLAEHVDSPKLMLSGALLERLAAGGAQAARRRGAVFARAVAARPRA